MQVVELTGESDEGQTHTRQKWTIRRRVGVVIVIVAVGAVGVSAISAYNALSTGNAVHQEQSHTVPAVVDANQFETALQNELNSENGFVTTGSDSQLTLFAIGQSGVATYTSRLASDLGTDTDLTSDLAAASAANRSWITSVADPQISEVQAGDVNAAVATGRSSLAETALTRVRETVTRLVSAVQSWAAGADRAVASGTDNAVTLVLIRGWFVLALLAGAWLALTRLISNPIERLHRDVRTVAGGDIDHPISRSGPPEIEQLGSDAEAMRRRLRDAGDQVRQLSEALAERSPLQGLLRSELEPSDDKLDVSIAARLVPAEGVLAGDWYDAWNSAGRGIVLAMVDVSGHGPEAGLLALKIKHLLAPPFRMGMQPGTAMSWLSDQLGDLGEQCASAIVLHIDAGTGRCRYANAGHPPGALIQSDGIVPLVKTGPILSAMGGTWETGEVTASGGDVLLLVTDGVTEARMPDGSELGMDRVLNALTRVRTAWPDEIVNTVVSTVRANSSDPFRDDVTVVAARFDTVTTRGDHGPDATVPGSFAAR